MILHAISFVKSFCQPPDRLRLPFSQYIINADRWDVSANWKYAETLHQSETVIAPPKPGENWNDWYNNLKTNRSYLRAQLNDTTAYFIEPVFDEFRKTAISFNKVADDIRIVLNEKVVLDAVIDPKMGGVKKYVDWQFEYKGRRFPTRQEPSIFTANIS